MVAGGLIPARGAARRLAPLLLALAALAAGCCLPATPYDARLACEAVGARYTDDGRCVVGGGP
jgi:hypothetical protein